MQCRFDITPHASLFFNKRSLVEGYNKGILLSYISVADLSPLVFQLVLNLEMNDLAAVVLRLGAKTISAIPDSALSLFL